MKKEHNLYKIKYEIYDSLFSENSIDGILSKAETSLNNPIFILDTSYRIITRSSLAKLENSSIETHNGEDYLLLDTVSLMKKNKCIDIIHNTNNSFFHEDDENLIFCSIRVNNIAIAYISILQSKKKFVDDDLEITNVLSKVLSMQIQKENLFISNSGLDEEYYLMDLLMNKIDDINYTKERLQCINFQLNRYLLILSVPFKQNYKDYRDNFGLKDLIKRFKNILGNCISTYYKDMIVFLISNDTEEVVTDYMKDKLFDILELNNLNCGASLVFENLNNLQDYFYQSTYILKLPTKSILQNKIFYFEDYIDHYLFQSYKNNNSYSYKIDLSTLIHPSINKLSIYDKENNTELLKTLRIYFKCNRNANETSRKLNIHRSTFFYRFNKIQSLLLLSLDDNNNLFKLELSLRIQNYLELP
ncbi:helix-turn-helix domain-containing protein [Clostridium sp. SHJSY1]|uniref:PucR family transcriptional regulator n=1 Tax=Clostridium sp. SHJSY1 TaxID=2942483 RepID=UPI00287647B9|nr:helix-turn-helix domain-containing protein [Clostridium sp. SHJSY1]MDS0525724.1 helix-turn-helix domain-containing protein [Clostridium sp. SHJSY1]